MKTRNLILLVLAVSIVVFKSYAQPSTTKTPVNSLKSGKWAFSFLLGSPSSSANYGSVNLTLKSQVTKIFAIRLGGSAYLSFGKGTNSSAGFYYDEQNQSSTTADIFLNFLFYTNPSKPLSFFLGLGPVYQYNENKSDYWPSGVGSQYDTETHLSTRGFAVGGAAVFGAEWFAFPGFSLTAEYNFSYTYGSSNGTITSIYTPPFGEHEYQVSATHENVHTVNLYIIKLGFSAYF